MLSRLCCHSKALQLVLRAAATGAKVPPGLPSPSPPLPAAWIARQRAAEEAPTSPLTGAPLPHLLLTPSHLVRSLVASLQAAGLLQG